MQAVFLDFEDQAQEFILFSGDWDRVSFCDTPGQVASGYHDMTHWLSKVKLF